MCLIVLDNISSPCWISIHLKCNNSKSICHIKDQCDVKNCIRVRAKKWTYFCAVTCRDLYFVLLAWLDSWRAIVKSWQSHGEYSKLVSGCVEFISIPFVEITKLGETKIKLRDSYLQNDSKFSITISLLWQIEKRDFFSMREQNVSVYLLTDFSRANYTYDRKSSGWWCPLTIVDFAVVSEVKAKLIVALRHSKQSSLALKHLHPSKQAKKSKLAAQIQFVTSFLWTYSLYLSWRSFRSFSKGPR